MSAYPENLAVLPEAERRKVLDRLPRQALVTVLTEVSGSTTLGTAVYHDLLCAAGVWHLTEAFEASAALEDLKPRVQRVKRTRENQPLIKRWNRQVARQSAGIKAFEALRRHPLVAHVLAKVLNTDPKERNA